MCVCERRQLHSLTSSHQSIEERRLELANQYIGVREYVNCPVPGAPSEEETDRDAEQALAPPKVVIGGRLLDGLGREGCFSCLSFMARVASRANSAEVLWQEVRHGPWNS